MTEEEAPSLAGAGAGVGVGRGAGGNTLLERIRQSQQQQQNSSQFRRSLSDSGLELEADQSREQATTPTLTPDTYSYASPPMMPPVYSPQPGMGNTGPSSSDAKEKLMEVLSTVGAAAGKAATVTFVQGKKLLQRITSSDQQTQSLLTEENSGHHYNPLQQNPEEDNVMATNTMQAPISQSSYNMTEYFNTFLVDMKTLFMQAPWFVKVAVIFLICLFFWLLFS